MATEISVVDYKFKTATMDPVIYATKRKIKIQTRTFFSTFLLLKKVISPFQKIIGTKTKEAFSNCALNFKNPEKV
jgi:hypothetical protein